MGAMLDAVGRHGYAGTTVDELVGLAGVSKTTFYGHFTSKEECFLVTFDEVVETASAQVRDAYRSGRGLRERLQLAFERFAEILVEQPGAARLVIVDSLSLGTTSMPHRDAATARFALLLRQTFEESGASWPISEVMLRALTGGVRRVAYRCLREGRPEEVREHIGEIMDWALEYTEGEDLTAWTLEAISQIEPDAAEEIPWTEPPNTTTAREVLSQRERIVRATAIATAERGYANASISAICGVAGVSHQSFYEHFADKMAAFLAAYGSWPNVRSAGPLPRSGRRRPGTAASPSESRCC